MNLTTSPSPPIAPSPALADHRNGIGWSYAAQGITLCLIAAVVFLCYRQLFGPGNWLSLEEDDFFYYLRVAENFAHGRGSTFGNIPTNGYHPLWMLLLAAPSLLPNHGPDLAVRVFLMAVFCASTMATYILGQRLLRPWTGDAFLVNALAMMPALYTMRLATSGMEVVLTIPLIFLLVVVLDSPGFWTRPSFGNSAGLGLLCSALFLSRLDSALLLCLLAAGLLVHPRLRQALRLDAVCLGLTPALAYLCLNRIYFHGWLPVSGAAKQLKSNHLPSWQAWASISHANALFMVPVAIAIVLLPQVYNRLPASRQVLYPVLLLFPFLYLLVISCLSDWHVWPWYFYGLRVALCISFAVFLAWPPSATLLRKPLAASVIALASLPILWQARREGSSHGFNNTYLNAIMIQRFAVTHPGRYAMGDRAGIVGYLLPDTDSLLQTEGLMADSGFLALIRSQVPLRDALERYGVDYYIATGDRPFRACYHAVEPAQAGPASPRMQDDFCAPPVASFQIAGEYTFLFALHAERKAPLPEGEHTSLKTDLVHSDP